MGVIDPISWKWLIPEIAFFPGKRVRVRVWRRALNIGVTMKYWAPFGVAILTPVMYALTKLDAYRVVNPALLFVPAFGIIHVALVALWRPMLRATVRECLREINRCEHCGYDLRGCTSDKCPECGRDWKPPRTLVSIDQAMLMD